MSGVAGFTDRCDDAMSARSRLEMGSARVPPASLHSCAAAVKGYVAGAVKRALLGIEAYSACDFKSM